MDSKHCTSLDLSRRLCEAGVKQESEFYWMIPTDTHQAGEYELASKDDFPLGSSPMECVDLKPCSAFLASELLEMLPEGTTLIKLLTKNEWGYEPEEKYQVSTNNDEDYYCMSDSFVDTQFYYSKLADTPSEALGELAHHLITKGLIDPKGI